MNKFIIAILVLIIVISGGYYIFYHYLENEGIIPTFKKSGSITIEKTLLGYHITAPLSVPLKEVFNKASQEAGFRIYYPAFIPSEMQLDRASIYWDNDSDTNIIASYNIGDINSQSPWVAVMLEHFQQSQDSVLLNKSLNSKQDIVINGNNGVLGITTGNGIIFNHLIYSTKDNVTVWIRSKDVDSDGLIEIAESMR